MPRVKRGPRGARRRKSILKQASGFRAGKSKLIRPAMEAVDKAGQYAYRHRRTKKREFRYLWNVRIGAAAKAAGLSYSQLIGALKRSGVELDRKILADIAANHPADFSAIIDEAKKAASA